MKDKAVLLAIACSISVQASLAQGIFEAGSLYGKSGAMGAGLHSGVGVAYGSSPAASGTSPVKMSQEQAGELNGQTKKLLDAADDQLRHGKVKVATDLYRKTAAWREAVFGGTDTVAFTSYQKAAKLYRKLGDQASAEECLQRVLAICSRKNGPGSTQSLPILDELSAIAKARGNYKDADSYCSQAMQLTERSYSPSDDKTVQERQKLIAVLDGYLKQLKATSKTSEAETVEFRLSQLRAVDASTKSSAVAAPAAAVKTTGGSTPAPATAPTTSAVAAPAAAVKTTAGTIQASVVGTTKSVVKMPAPAVGKSATAAPPSEPPAVPVAETTPPPTAEAVAQPKPVTEPTTPAVVATPTHTESETPPPAAVSTPPHAEITEPTAARAAESPSPTAVQSPTISPQIPTPVGPANDSGGGSMDNSSPSPGIGGSP